MSRVTARSSMMHIICSHLTRAFFMEGHLQAGLAVQGVINCAPGIGPLVGCGVVRGGGGQLTKQPASAGGCGAEKVARVCVCVFVCLCTNNVFSGPGVTRVGSWLSMFKNACVNTRGSWSPNLFIKNPKGDFKSVPLTGPSFWCGTTPCIVSVRKEKWINIRIAFQIPDPLPCILSLASCDKVNHRDSGIWTGVNTGCSWTLSLILN